MPAVITIGPEQRKGNIRVAYKKGTQVVEETYHYLVSTSEPATREEIVASVGFPSPGLTVSPSGLGRCTNYSLVRKENNILYWDLEVNYSNNLEEDTGGGGGGDPKDWVPVYETFLEPYTEYIVQDLDGRPVVNGAGTPYRDGLPVEKDIIRWDFFQFEAATITDEQIADRNNTINSVTFKTRAKHTLLLKIRRSVVGFYYGFPCRMTEYSLLWKESNWHSRLPNAGQTFLYDDDMEIYTKAYRYKDKPDLVETGPLGLKNYRIADLANITDQYDFAANNHEAGKPTGGVDFLVSGKPDTAVALRPESPALYFIEYRNFKESNFSFLRV